MLKDVYGLGPVNGLGQGLDRLARQSAHMADGKAFSQVLERVGQPYAVRFSAHALNRIQGRNICLSPTTWRG